MKVGVVGLGSIGLRHARNLRDMGHEVTAYDTDERKMWDFQGHTNARLTCFSDTDAVVIASPSICHVDDLRTAAIYGVPPLIEKPLGMEVTDELRALVAEIKNDERAAMVGYNLRFHSCAIKAKEWMDRGAIGNPLWAHFFCCQYNDRPAYKRDGVIHNWSHEIDLALWLLGPATVMGVCATTEVADLLLRHQSGCQSSIHLDYLCKPERRFLTILGSKGMLDADLLKRNAIMLSGGADQDSFVGTDIFDENYIAEMKAFLRRAEGKPAFGATLEDGLAVLEICDTARKMAGLK